MPTPRTRTTAHLGERSVTEHRSQRKTPVDRHAVVGCSARRGRLWPSARFRQTPAPVVVVVDVRQQMGETGA
ncbi:hypothetical protein SGRIM119S_07699 [Streptomyces griseorubiginosus]